MTGLLLVNLGTPDSTSVRDVRRYLTEFLTDPRVIDVPWLQRQLLVRCIIAPFRAPKSAKTYREIWTERGSPLKFHGEDLRDALAERLGSGWKVELAMRYRNPSIAAGLEQLRAARVDRIIIFPLFPQYASATTGSVHEAVMQVVAGWQNVPDIRFVRGYPDHPAFIEAFVAAAHSHDLDAYDHVLFSYHGLPERQIRKADESRVLSDGGLLRRAGARQPDLLPGPVLSPPRGRWSPRSGSTRSGPRPPFSPGWEAIPGSSPTPRTRWNIWPQTAPGACSCSARRSWPIASRRSTRSGSNTATSSARREATIWSWWRA